LRHPPRPPPHPRGSSTSLLERASKRKTLSPLGAKEKPSLSLSLSLERKGK